MDAIIGNATPVKTRHRLWKMNSAILEEEELKREFQDFWQGIICHPSDFEDPEVIVECP